MKKSTTDWVILASIVSVLGYEAYTLLNRKPKDTISERTWRAVAKRPLLSAALGAVFAHFVWQAQDIYDRYRNEE